MEIIKKYLRICLNIVIPLAGIVLSCTMIPKLLGYFMPFVIGWLIAMVANPLVRFLESRMKLVRKHSSVLIVVVALALVIGLGYFLVSRLLMQAFSLARDLPEMYAAASSGLEGFFRRFDEMIRFLPENVKQVWYEFTGNVGHTIKVLVQKVASPTVEAAGNVAIDRKSTRLNSSH